MEVSSYQQLPKMLIFRVFAHEELFFRKQTFSWHQKSEFS